jgi:hypothetical protein
MEARVTTAARLVTVVALVIQDQPVRDRADEVLVGPTVSLPLDPARASNQVIARVVRPHVQVDAAVGLGQETGDHVLGEPEMAQAAAEGITPTLPAGVMVLAPSTACLPDDAAFGDGALTIGHCQTSDTDLA